MIDLAFVGLTRLLTGVLPRWRGCEPAPGCRVYFANHCSHLDFLVIWAALPRPLRSSTRPVAAEDYWTRGPIRRYLATKVFNAVLIPRSGFSREHHPIDLMAAACAAGDALIVFPEGTRGENDDPAPFRPGLYHLAKACPQAELIPVYLENMNRILPKGECLPVPLIGGVHFGAPIRLQDDEDRTTFLTRAHDAVTELHHAVTPG